MLATVPFTIPAGKASATITDYAVMVDLSHLPAPWWSQVATDGSDIRVKQAGVDIPRHVIATGFDKSAKTGILYFKATLTTSANVFAIECGSGAAAPGVTDPIGRNAAFSNYDVFIDWWEAVDQTDGSTVTLEGTASLSGGNLVCGSAGNAYCAASNFTVWTMSTGATRADTSQRALLSISDSTTSNTPRATLLYRGSTSWQIWNSTDTFLSTGSTITAARFAHTQNGTTDRKAYVNGTATTDTGCAQRPTSANRLWIGVEDASYAERFNGTVRRNTYYRSGEISAAWAAAETENYETPATFYTVGTTEFTLASAPTVTTTAHSLTIPVDLGLVTVTTTVFPILGLDALGVVTVTTTALPITVLEHVAVPNVFLGADDDQVDVVGDVIQASARRGLAADGVLEKLEPGVATVTLKGASYSPLTNDLTRPGRPLVLAVTDGDAVTTAFTGTILRAVLRIDKDTGLVYVTLTATDAVPDLAAPYTIAHGGRFAQRVTPLLEAAGVAYEVHDDQPDQAVTTLKTSGKNVAEQLMLACNSLHGFVFVDSDNVVQAYADQERSSAPAALELGAADYVFLDPGFDTDDLVNSITVETLVNPDNLSETITDPSADDWRLVHQDVTVNSGSADSHAYRFMARLPGPGITAKSLTVNATKANALVAMANLEPYQPVHVELDGVLDDDQQVLALEHVLTADPAKSGGITWLTTITLRRREVLPLRWNDVPPSITWDDPDPAMTWNTAVYWHP